MYKLNTIPTKVQTIHFMTLDKLMLMFIQKHKHLIIARKIVKKEELQVMTSSHRH